MIIIAIKIGKCMENYRWDSLMISKGDELKIRRFTLILYIAIRMPEPF